MWIWIIKQRHEDEVDCYVFKMNNISMKITLILGLTPYFSFNVDITFYIPPSTTVFLQMISKKCKEGTIVVADVGGTLLSTASTSRMYHSWLSLSSALLARMAP